MSLTKNAVSMLIAGVLGLSLGCSGSPRHAPATAPAAASPAPVAPEPTPPAPRAAATPAGKSPMQALNQMVTAQALLVSLLLAPLSKGGGEEELARVDAAPSSAPTR